MRTIIVHCHMFKNAGTTLDWSLRRNFGERFLEHTDNESMRQGGEYLGPFLEQHATMAAVSSHHLRLPLPELTGARILPIVLLRDPLDRVGSVYQFEVRQKARTPGAINAKRLSFSEYVRWRMDPTAGATIRNYQTRCCAGKITRPRIPIVEDDYRRAQQFLAESPLVGLVERFDESMVWFEAVLRRYFPQLDLAYVKQNVGAARKGGLAERVEQIKSGLGPEVYDLLVANNHWDQKLYADAERLLADRVIGLGDLEFRLAEFRRRCQLLGH